MPYAAEPIADPSLEKGLLLMGTALKLPLCALTQPSVGLIFHVKCSSEGGPEAQ